MTVTTTTGAGVSRDDHRTYGKARAQYTDERRVTFEKDRTALQVCQRERLQSGFALPSAGVRF
jgi:hypothetical protein